MLKFGSLFSGHGGLDLGLEQAGMKCVLQVENDPNSQQVLSYHWPDVMKYGDITGFRRKDWKIDIDVLAGGFPCQDLSVGSKEKKGLQGERSGLWSEYLRLIKEYKPLYCIIENVPTLLARGGNTIVLRDLAKSGYDAEWQTVRASDFALPHRRERVLFVAYSHKIIRRQCEGMGIEPERTPEVFGSGGEQCSKVWIPSSDHLIGVDDGVPRSVYPRSVCGLGNAVAVPVARWVGQKVIEHYKRLWCKPEADTSPSHNERQHEGSKNE